MEARLELFLIIDQKDMLSQSLPVSQNERADILDVLRGFALLGVLMDNLFGFTGWGFLSQEMRAALPTWPADGPLALLERTFVHGKFYSIFSLLFGIGFSIILIRNEQKGINPLKIFYRRLLILLVIGAVHLFFIWEGDILFLYALIGLILPLFRKCSDRALLIWTGALILSPILIDAIKALFDFRTGGFLFTIAQEIDKKNGIPLDASSSQYLYKEGSGFREWRRWMEPGFFYRYSDLIETNRIPKVLGLFLLGFYVGRKMMYAQIENYVSLFKKLRLWGFAVGVPAAIAWTYFAIFGQMHMKPELAMMGDTFFYAFSVVPLSLAYTSVICLHWTRRKGKTRLKVLASMGRMALTNYLMQSILGIIIFYNLGFGLGGDIGPAVYFPIGLAIYGFQVLYSNFWFKYFNYGPLEWIWRMLTYRKRLSIKKTNNT